MVNMGSLQWLRLMREGTDSLDCSTGETDEGTSVWEGGGGGHEDSKRATTLLSDNASAQLSHSMWNFKFG